MVLPFFNFKVSAQLNADKSNKQNDRTENCNFPDTTFLLVPYTRIATGWMPPAAKKISASSSCAMRIPVEKNPARPRLRRLQSRGYQCLASRLRVAGLQADVSAAK